MTYTSGWASHLDLIHGTWRRKNDPSKTIVITQPTSDPVTMYLDCKAGIYLDEAVYSSSVSTKITIAFSFLATIDEQAAPKTLVYYCPIVGCQNPQQTLTCISGEAWQPVVDPCDLNGTWENDTNSKIVVSQACLLGAFVQTTGIQGLADGTYQTRFLSPGLSSTAMELIIEIDLEPNVDTTDNKRTLTPHTLIEDIAALVSPTEAIADTVDPTVGDPYEEEEGGY